MGSEPGAARAGRLFRARACRYTRPVMEEPRNSFYWPVYADATFAGLAVLIASLGALGLAMQLAVSRQKELGVRKVMGASVIQLARLLSKELVMLVILANVIAAPFAIWAMQGWLQNFAYAISIGWQVLVLTGALSILIALFSTIFTLTRAARLNPSETLRME